MRITFSVNSYVNLIGEDIFNSLTPLQKKVTAVAIGILSIFTLCYLYYHFKAKKKTDENLSDSPKISKSSIFPITPPILKKSGEIASDIQALNKFDDSKNKETESKEVESDPTLDPLSTSHSELFQESSSPVLKQVITTPMGTLIAGIKNSQGLFETAQVTFKNGLVINNCESIKKLEDGSKIEGVFDSHLNGFGNIEREEGGFLVLNKGEFLKGKLDGQGRYDCLEQGKKIKPNEVIYMEGEFIKGNFQFGKIGFKTGASVELVFGKSEFLLQLAYGVQIKCKVENLSCTSGQYYEINGGKYQKVQGFFDENLNGIGTLATLWGESIGEFRNGQLQGWGYFKGIEDEDFKEGIFVDGKCIKI